MKIILLGIFVIIYLSVFYSCQKESFITPTEDVPAEAYLSTTVIDVSDGDTFAIYYKNQKWKVRVLYVDCFETQMGDRLNTQARKAGITVDSALKLGLKAKDFAKKTLLNQKVELIRDFNEPNLDVYGRLLRITVVGKQRYDSLLRVNNLVVP